MINILGLLSAEETQKFKLDKSLHCKSRKDREDLICKKAKPLFYFEVHRRKDNSRQVHCLLNDATVLIFNKENRKLITIIITKRSRLDKYLKAIKDIIEEDDLMKLCRCAKLNKSSNAIKVGNNFSLDSAELTDYLTRKNNILN